MFVYSHLRCVISLHFHYIQQHGKWKGLWGCVPSILLQRETEFPVTTQSAHCSGLEAAGYRRCHLSPYLPSLAVNLICGEPAELRQQTWNTRLLLSKWEFKTMQSSCLNNLVFFLVLFLGEPYATIIIQINYMWPWTTKAVLRVNYWKLRCIHNSKVE